MITSRGARRFMVLVASTALTTTALASAGAVVTAPAGSPLVVDTFGRTLAAGWGSADTGGAWIGSTRFLSVSGGTGKIVVAAPGRGPSVFLPATTTSDADLTVTMSSDKVGTGNGVYLSAMGRRVTGAGDYRFQTRLHADGLVGAMILRTDAVGAQTALTPEATVPGYHFAAGDKLNVRFQVTGTSPTTLRAKVWPAAAAEPSTWLRSANDTTTGLQVAGNVGFMTYLSSSGTNAPVTTSFDNLYVRPTTPGPSGTEP